MEREKGQARTPEKIKTTGPRSVGFGGSRMDDRGHRTKDRKWRTFSLVRRPSSYVLAAVDVDLGAVHVGRGVGAQHVDDLGDLVGGAETVHRDLMRDDLLGAGREDCGIDLARRDGVDADAER